MSSAEVCRHQDGITEAINQAQPMLHAAMSGLDLMIDSAAAMNRAQQSVAMFDKNARAELDHINDVTARTMTHRSDIEELVDAISSEVCLESGVGCKETCQKIGAIARLSELLVSSPQR